MNLKVHQKFFKSFDGTKIGYQVLGRGKKHFILCNGLGGTIAAWAPLYEHFKNKYKFIAWDYRGIVTSDRPKNLKNLSIAHHCRDLDMLLKKEGVEQAFFAGWSMGVQVCLEYYRKHAKQYKGMILINGTSGYPYDTVLNSPLSKYIIPKTNMLLKTLMPRLQPKLKPIAKLVIDSNDFIKLVTKLGMINKNLNSDMFRQVAHDIVNTDLSLYSELLDQLNEHDATAVLSKIKVPALIIAGTKDIMTPSHVAIEMCEKIKKSELMMLENASHYSLMEFPEIINKRIEDFLKSLGSWEK